jgi:hypothetical protein
MSHEIVASPLPYLSTAPPISARKAGSTEVVETQPILRTDTDSQLEIQN